MKFSLLIFSGLLLANARVKCQSFFYGRQLFSTAGFFQLKNNSSRQVFSFNNGWYYHKGDVPGAQKADFDENGWQQVQLPHGTDILPEYASGGINYQGIIWYRKHFHLPESIQNKHILLHFEAIMGKCKIYLNGKLVKEHEGGYLPVVIDVTQALNRKGENVIAVMADNSDDASYPPGKPQYVLDFCYFGGIYRDAWLVATNDVHITDPNLVDKVAGGGVFVHFENVNKKEATVKVATNIQNESTQHKTLYLETALQDPSGKIVAKTRQKFSVSHSGDVTLRQSLQLSDPFLWNPEHPYLYDLYSIIKTAKGDTVDGYYQRIGVRSIAFKGRKGFYLNGEPFKGKLIGANHHQDYANIGNALSNNLHWRDAKKLRDAGVQIVRLSHYPQDPAFMDACDELGIFAIVATPGWQFWNKDPMFAQRVYNDVRQMVRRDRNHPSVIAWEPILNETYYPAAFARQTYKEVHEEYPFDGCYAACDYGHPGYEVYDLLYSAPDKKVESETDKCLFMREWGDNVDDWDAQNSPSRAAISWGEVPQLVQAIHYADPSYPFPCWETFYEADSQFVGGCLWHSFDTQRGYHPDPFYGGIMDIYRQPKYSYELFKSQQNPTGTYAKAVFKNPYTLFIANILSPFSPEDVTVFTNCDSVKLVVNGEKTYTAVPDKNLKMPHPFIVFKNVFHFMDFKETARGKSKAVAGINATGYVNGKPVVTATRLPAGRPVKIKLSADMEGMQAMADGSCVIPVVASVTDSKGTIKRLNEDWIRFSVTGPGVLIGDGQAGINPRKVEWGTVPVLIKTTLTPGTIRIVAQPVYQGTQTLAGDTLDVRTISPEFRSIYESQAVRNIQPASAIGTPALMKTGLSEKQKSNMLKTVEHDQEVFETNK